MKAKVAVIAGTLVDTAMGLPTSTLLISLRFHWKDR